MSHRFQHLRQLLQQRLEPEISSELRLPWFQEDQVHLCGCVFPRRLV